MAKLINTIWPFGQNCSPLEGEVSEETKAYLIESCKATEEDFEPSEEEVEQPKSNKKTK